MSAANGSATRLSGADATAFRVIARSLVRELSKRGYGVPHIVALAGELIELAVEAR